MFVACVSQSYTKNTTTIEFFFNDTNDGSEKMSWCCSYTCTNHFGWFCLSFAKIYSMILPKVFYFCFTMVFLVEYPLWNWNCSVNLTVNLRFTTYSRCLRSSVIYDNSSHEARLCTNLIIFYKFWVSDLLWR